MDTSMAAKHVKYANIALKGHADAPLSDIPPEILEHIISYLPVHDITSAALVCKKWSSVIGRSKTVWKTVLFEKAPGLIKKKLWRKIQKSGTTCVDFNCNLFSNAQLVRSTTRYLKNLTSVTAIYMNSAAKDDLRFILEHMQQLRILRINCLLPCVPPNDTRDAYFFFDWNELACLRGLEELRVSSMKTMFHPTLSFFIYGSTLADLTNLRKLSLTNFDGIEDKHLVFLEHLNQLESLELGNFADNCTFATLAPKSLEGLKSLSLTQAHCRCLQYSCHCLIPALHNLPRLEKLTLLMCVIPEGLHSMLMTMKHLTTLEMWPYLDRFYPPAELPNTFYIDRVAETYVSLVSGLRHLRRAKMGILDECLRTVKSPFQCTGQENNNGDELRHSVSSDEEESAKEGGDHCEDDEFDRLSNHGEEEHDECISPKSAEGESLSDEEKCHRDDGELLLRVLHSEEGRTAEHSNSNSPDASQHTQGTKGVLCEEVKSCSSETPNKKPEGAIKDGNMVAGLASNSTCLSRCHLSSQEPKQESSPADGSEVFDLVRDRVTALLPRTELTLIRVEVREIDERGHKMDMFHVAETVEFFARECACWTC